MTTLITKQEKIQRVIGRFGFRCWRSKKIDKHSDVYMVYKPDLSEFCYFVAFTNDSINLLPEQQNESYSEAKTIIKEALKQ